MATPTTGQYPHDPTGNATSNRVSNELHTVQASGSNYYIIPRAAPFFAKNSEVLNAATNAPFKENVDYVFGHIFPEAIGNNGKPVYGSIVFTNKAIAGLVKLNYNTLGGDWGHSEAAITNEITNLLLNPITRSWGQVEGFPFSYPPIDHDQSLDSLVGSADILAALAEMADALTAMSGGVSQNHLLDYGNPHKVTQVQVGLGLVPNWAPATETQARDGVNNTSFMSPLRGAQQIQALALGPLNVHIADTRNPHNTNKAQVGLPLVPNYAPATRAEAEAANRDDRFATMQSVRWFFEANSTQVQLGALEAQLDAHEANFLNPHRTTAAQVGAFTKEEITNLLKDVKAADSTRFASFTEAEWRTSIPSHAELGALITTLNETFTDQGVLFGSITAPTATPIRTSRLLRVQLDFAHYAIEREDGVVVPVPSYPAGVTWLQPEEYFLGDQAYYVTNQAGYILALGANALQPPTSFRPAAGVPPVPGPDKLSASKTAGYCVLDDGTAFSWGNTSVRTNLPTTNIVDIKTAHGTADHTLVLTGAGVVVPYGMAQFKTAATAALVGAVAAKAIAIGNTAMWLLSTTGKLFGWNIVGAGTAGVSLTPIALGATIDAMTFTAISGSYQHYAFLRDDATVVTYGDSTDGKRALAADLTNVISVSAGYAGTVTLTGTGEVKFWGRDDNNLMTPPANPEIVVA